jgi:serine beta-lactamase-like protein LACTB
LDSVPDNFEEVISWGFEQHAPGIAAIVVRDGKTLLRTAIGMADIEKDVPIEPDMSFRIGSLTKPFTAAAIMLLSERGRLNVIMT